MREFWAEFFGTCFLLTLGNGVVANHVLARTKGQGTGFLMVCIGWGLAVALSVFCVGRLSGAHLNPAVTVGLWSINLLETRLVPYYLTAQFLGAALGAFLVWLAYSSHWGVTEDADLKLAAFCTSPGVRSPGANLFCEVLGTAALVWGVLGIGENGDLLSAGGTQELFNFGIKPALIGALVTSIGVSLGGPTGYAINSFRDFAPRLMHAILPIPGKRDSDWGYAWIPLCGPLLGGIFGAWLFRLLERYTG